MLCYIYIGTVLLCIINKPRVNYIPMRNPCRQGAQTETIGPSWFKTSPVVRQDRKSNFASFCDNLFFIEILKSWMSYVIGNRKRRVDFIKMEKSLIKVYYNNLNQDSGRVFIVISNLWHDKDYRETVFKETVSQSNQFKLITWLTFEHEPGG